MKDLKHPRNSRNIADDVSRTVHHRMIYVKSIVANGRVAREA